MSLAAGVDPNSALIVREILKQLENRQCQSLTRHNGLPYAIS
jgi:hypothetical protein